MTEITEGKAVIRLGKGVFFNPKMQGLRSMSVAFLKALENKNLSLLDSTAATGVRGIRYSLEAGIKNAEFIDINKSASKAAAVNVKRNGLKCKVLGVSIQELANTSEERFDIIDLDPFGSPAPCIYDIMKLSRDNTVLMVTATDTAVLCGAHPSACIKIYSAKPLHSEHCKEAGLRILLGFILRNAAQFNMGIEPLMSVSDMHYMRVFVRLRPGASSVKNAFRDMGSGSFCRNCRNYSCKNGIAPILDATCKNCGKSMDTFGTLWLGKLYDKELIKKVSKHASEDVKEQANLLYNEYDTPFFYSIPKITKSLGMTSVSPKIVIAKLRSKGFKATKTQFDKDGVKTDAGIEVVRRIVKD